MSSQKILFEEIQQLPGFDPSKSAVIEKFMINGKPYTIFYSPEYEKLKGNTKHYVLGEKFSEGNAGTVYNCYPIDHDGNIVQEDVRVMKIGEFNEKNLAEAAYYKNKLFPNTQATRSENRLYLLTEFAPGKELKDIDWQQLSFADRIYATQQFALALHILHHTTAATGKAITHNDLHHRNIKINFRKVLVTSADGISRESIVTDVYLLDYGNAKSLITDQQLKQSCDISWLAKHFQKILFNAYFKNGKNLAEEENLAEYEPIKKYLLKFLAGMQSRKVNSDEILQFFTVLSQISQAFEHHRANKQDVSEIDHFLLYETKLALLSNNLWFTEIGEKSIEQFSLKNEILQKNSPLEKAKTFADFDFGSTNPTLLRKLKTTQNTADLEALLSQYNSLDTPETFNQAVAVEKKSTHSTIESNDRKNYEKVKAICLKLEQRYSKKIEIDPETYQSKFNVINKMINITNQQVCIEEKMRAMSECYCDNEKILEQEYDPINKTLLSALKAILVGTGLVAGVVPGLIALGIFAYHSHTKTGSYNFLSDEANKTSEATTMRNTLFSGFKARA